jgi:hypothetical protein
MIVMKVITIKVIIGSNNVPIQRDIDLYLIPLYYYIHPHYSSS